MIELVKYLPDISQDVNLRDLEIDTKTIQNVVQFANIMAELPVIQVPITNLTKLFVEGSPYERFFTELSDEELLLLVLAAHKLDYKDLQMVCSAKIAQMFACMSDSDIRQELSIDELTIDEEDYLRFSHFGWESRF